MQPLLSHCITHGEMAVRCREVNGLLTIRVSDGERCAAATPWCPGGRGRTPDCAKVFFTVTRGHELGIPLRGGGEAHQLA